MLAQPPPDGSGLLWAQVEREVLLLRVKDAELLSLVGVDDGEDARDRFAEVVTASHLRVRSAIMERHGRGGGDSALRTSFGALRRRLLRFFGYGAGQVLS